MAADNEPASRGTHAGAVRDHLANERTLLAWQRTALAIIGIGFLVDRFALGASGSTFAGSVIGTGLIVLGAVASVTGTYRFLQTEREIDTDSYQPAVLVHLALTGALVVGALMLAVFIFLTPD